MRRARVSLSRYVPPTIQKKVFNAKKSSKFHRFLQIEKYLELPGVSKSNFCAIALQGIDRKALDKLLSTYSSTEVNHWQSHYAYRRAWVFFEQKRIFDGQAKSKKRRHIEMNHPKGLAFQALTSEYFTETATKRHGRPKRDTVC